MVRRVFHKCGEPPRIKYAVLFIFSRQKKGTTMKRIEFKDTQEQLEQKWADARIELKADGLADGVLLHIKAYALAFGNVDSWGDIILPGACDAFLKSADAERLALCWQHDMRTVIGKITNKGTDEYGMWIEADILDTVAGRDAAVLLKSGAVKEFSIGYRADKYSWEKREGYDYDIRILEAITVYECSPVTRAANPNAIILSAKAFGHDAPAADQEQPEQEEAPKNEENTNPKLHQTMTPEEIKAMRESIEKAAAEKVAAEVAEKVKELKAAQETIEAQEKSIDNLDKSMKALQAKYDGLSEQLKEKAKATFFGAIKAAVEERKADIEEMLKKNSGSLKISFEHKNDYDVTVAGDITRIGWGAALDANIAGGRAPINAFYDLLPKDQVNALFVNWLEGTFTDQTGYVDELATMADENAAAEEKTRKMAKGGSHILISSEVTDFFAALYEWARGKAQEKLAAWADGEVFGGAGADTNDTTKKKVYGLKSQATAFSALGSYAFANAADVIWDASCQAKKEGYQVTHAFVPWADYAAIIGLKDKNGRNLYDPATGTIKGVRIQPSSAMSADTMLVADINVCRIKERPVYELEIVRNAKLDGWDVYVRKSLQLVVKTPDKKGVIWVASVATAVAAIDAGESTLGDVVTKLGAVKDELTAIKTNTGNIKDYTTAVGAINTAITKLAGAVNASDQIETHPNTQ